MANKTVCTKMLDLAGLKCPYPALKTEQALRGLPAGSMLDIITTDPMAIIDIPHFCNKNGHEIVQQKALEEGFLFRLKKSGAE